MRLIVAILAAVILSSSALAHAILVESTPAANAVVTGSSVALTLRYNSRIDKARSQLMLLRPDKSETKLAIAEDGPEDILTATVTLDPGAYRIRWQVLAIDGHITRGDLPFTVAAE
jgi:methionine-rich copper-binding protein CopC